MRKRKHGSQAGHVRRTSLLVYSVLTGNPRMYGYVCTYGMYSASRPWEKKRKKKGHKRLRRFFFSSSSFLSILSIHTFDDRSTYSSLAQPS